MSVQYCELHGRHYDADFELNCKFCEDEMAEILQKIEDGEIDILAAAEDLLERGASCEEIEAAVGPQNWVYILGFWAQQ